MKVGGKSGDTNIELCLTWSLGYPFYSVKTVAHTLCISENQTESARKILSVYLLVVLVGTGFESVTQVYQILSFPS